MVGVKPRGNICHVHAKASYMGENVGDGYGPGRKSLIVHRCSALLPAQALLVSSCRLAFLIESINVKALFKAASLRRDE